MKFTETPLQGVFLIDLEKRGDDRGFFARLFCEREFQQHGLNPRIVQANNSDSRYRGTLRGIHYQLAPKAEDKTFRCVRGSLFDVVIDLRPSSDIPATFRRRTHRRKPHHGPCAQGLRQQLHDAGRPHRDFLSVPANFIRPNTSAASVITTPNSASAGPWNRWSFRTRTGTIPTSTRQPT